MDAIAVQRLQSQITAAVHQLAGELGDASGLTDESACGMRSSTEAVPHDAIAQRAYLRAAHRGFEPGHEREDWLAAEAELAGLWFAAECESDAGAKAAGDC